MVRKVLLAVTSCERLGNTGKVTGLWLQEAGHFYDELTKEGWLVELVSPKGGFVPVDPSSIKDGLTADDLRIYADPGFRYQLGHSLTPDSVLKSGAKNYSAIYFAGGHGTSWDFLDNVGLQKIAAEIYENGGIVSSVCHGVIGLINIKLSNGSHLINGKNITGFSNEEENMVQLEKVVPFLVEDKLIQTGANYNKAPQAFQPWVVTDDRLVTGQNPFSSRPVAEKVVEILKEK